LLDKEAFPREKVRDRPPTCRLLDISFLVTCIARAPL